MNKKNIYSPVIPGSRSDAEVIRMYHAGHVYFGPHIQTKSLTYDDVTDLILEYVSRIAPYAAPDYADCIDKIWERIATDVHIRPHLIIKKGKDKGMPNKYHITHIVSMMALRNIYDKRYTAHDLHLKLEQTKKRNKYFTTMNKYEAKGEEKNEIINILNLYPKKKM